MSPEPMIDLTGRVALVSGGAGGIGAATAAELARVGARVVVADRDAELLAATVERLRADGAEVAGVTADVTSDADCKAAVDEAVARFGRLDVLVNNAAVGSFDATLDSTSVEEWNRVVAINLTSVFLLSRHAVPAMRVSGDGGCVVNISSIHAHATSSGVLPYAAAKGGVLSMTRAMAIDLAPDRIRAVAVLPGAVDTPMLRQHVAQHGTLEDLGITTALDAIGRMGSPAEVARAIVFLASPAASFVNGTGLLVDGGLSSGF